MVKIFILILVFGQLNALECQGPIEPGLPGLQWTKEELEVTRKKVT